MDNINIAFSVNKQKLPQLRTALAALLSDSICKVTFEKADGSGLSEMKCTLRKEHLPPLKEGAEKKAPVLDTLPVWKLDSEKSGWRSFRLDSLKSVEVIYE